MKKGRGKMQHYLSFGGGVNSVALYLLMEQLDMEFEAIFVNHGGDWPETYEYVEYFISTGRPVTVITPVVQKEKTLVEFCLNKRMTPNRRFRWCTDHWKVRPLLKYFKIPCFSHIGIDAGESRRAKISSNSGVENRYLLIEHDIDRDGCLKIIKAAGLENPGKSGCWFCPFQRIGQWRRLRRDHPDLFCQAVKMEQGENERRAEQGKAPYYTIRENMPLSKLVGKSGESQRALPGLESMEYPPCQCGL